MASDAVKKGRTNIEEDLLAEVVPYQCARKGIFSYVEEKITPHGVTTSKVCDPEVAALRF